MHVVHTIKTRNRKEVPWVKNSNPVKKSPFQGRQKSLGPVVEEPVMSALLPEANGFRPPQNLTRDTKSSIKPNTENKTKLDKQKSPDWAFLFALITQLYREFQRTIQLVVQVEAHAVGGGGSHLTRR